MSKLHYFSNKYSKIAKHWGLSGPSTLSIRYWWPKDAWFISTFRSSCTAK